ncbi:MAG TPA: hypothetical protein VLG40_02080 [Candidatus Saccharimonas sp.]|nr:hypothetical protein [Candidatus Saccharimonas sp.]
MLARLTGFAAIILLCGAASYVLYRYPRQHHRSLSMHIGDQRETILLFAGVTTPATILLYVSLTFWLAPKLGVNNVLFQSLLIPAVVCQILAAWIPHTTGWRVVAHTFFAYSMAFFMMLLVIYFCTLSTLGPIARATALLTATYMIVCLGILQFLAPVKRKFLFYQLSFVGGFCATILVIMAGV